MRKKKTPKLEVDDLLGSITETMRKEMGKAIVAMPGMPTVKDMLEANPKPSTGPCRNTHPTLKLLNGEIHGANCSYPEAGFDIYIGLDHSMADMRGYPWEKHAGANAVDVHFPVMDMGVPKGDDVAVYKQMVAWLVEQLQAGKRIHVGCIGGHGRTGTLLSAIVATATGNVDATAWVRKHYCPKAVESQAQVDFLKKEFGITPVEPTKGYAKVTKASGYKSPYKASTKEEPAPGGNKGLAGSAYKAVPSNKRIWSH